MLTQQVIPFNILLVRIFNEMNLNTPLHRLILSLFVLLLTTTLIAETQPKFSIIPTTPTTITVPVNRSVTVIYRVTNQTKLTRTLTMKGIPGITQATFGAGYCSNPFTLASGHSCLLVLPIIGSQIPGKTVIGGPVICKTKGPGDNSPDPFLCSEACNGNSLNITIGVSTYLIGGTITNLTGSGFVLQNNGGDDLAVPAGMFSFQFSKQIPLGGFYNVTIKTQPLDQTCLVSNGSGGPVTADVTNVVVNCYLTLKLADKPSTYKEVNQPYFQTNTASGGSPPYIFSLSSGTLPAGTTFNPVNGTVSGTPIAAGAFSYIIKVTDSVGVTATAKSSGVIAPLLTLTHTASAFLEVGTTYSQTNVASGGLPPYVYALASGALPAGTTLNTSTGTVSGLLTTAENFSYVIKVTDKEGITLTAPSTGTIVGSVSLLATASALTEVNQPYSQLNTITPTLGVPPYTYTLDSGDFPAGVTTTTPTLNTTTGSITLTVSGTPTTAGVFSYVIKVTDSLGKMATAASSGTITGPMGLMASVSTNMKVGFAYSQVNTVTGVGGVAPYTYTLVSGGAFPAGVTTTTPTLGVASPSTTLTVSGTPTVPGNFSYTIKVTDSLGAMAVATSSGTIEPLYIIFMTSASYTGDLGGITHADAICQSDGDKLFSGVTYKALLITSTRFPCSGGPSNPGCAGTYQSSDWPLAPGTVYYNPDKSVFNTVNTSSVFNGSVNNFQYIHQAPVSSGTQFFSGIQSSLSGNISPYDLLGWAYVNMNASTASLYSSFSPQNCFDYTNDGVLNASTAGRTGAGIANLGTISANFWGNWNGQTDGPGFAENFVSNVWIQNAASGGSIMALCNLPIEFICVTATQ
jgi:hypothetical protein